MNNMFALFDLGGTQILVIMALILIFFGARRIPELAKGLGQGIKEFKKATREVTDEIHNAGEANSAQVQTKQITNAAPLDRPTSAPQAAIPQSTEQKA